MVGSANLNTHATLSTPPLLDPSANSSVSLAICLLISLSSEMRPVFVSKAAPLRKTSMKRLPRLVGK
ncbi:Uncharacterised protein [Mycobacteroides abscessus subsp. abscessus]|nr:Uncharacterised protein [Mycobacteroides abscessus subsp. abscessus]